jgi:hypothetical protein
MMRAKTIMYYEHGEQREREKERKRETESWSLKSHI